MNEEVFQSECSELNIIKKKKSTLEGVTLKKQTPLPGKKKAAQHSDVETFTFSYLVLSLQARLENVLTLHLKIPSFKL